MPMTNPWPADAYLSLEALALYSGLSVSSLRRLIADPTNPIPHYRFNRHLKVKRSDFDDWAQSCRVQHTREDVNAILDRMVKG